MWTVTAIAAGVLMLSSGGSPLDSTLGLAETRHAPPDLRRTTPDQAKPFLGWITLVEGPSGPVTFLIQVKVAEGSVVATVSSELMGTNTIQDVSNTENGISLRYTGDLWGYSATNLDASRGSTSGGFRDHESTVRVQRNGHQKPAANPRLGTLYFQRLQRLVIPAALHDR